MAELISRQAAIDALCRECSGNCIPCDSFPCGEVEEIQKLPSANAAEVVRCRDCKYRDEMGRCEMWECYQMPDMGFCHEGVRKDG